MTCSSVQFFRANGADFGVKAIGTNDGYTVNLSWYRSYANPPNTYQIYYNIYFSMDPINVFNEGPKFVSNSPNYFVKIQDNFKVGSMYYFAVRATAFEIGTFDYSFLSQANPTSNYLAVYPETLLSTDITVNTTNIPVLDSSIFPPYGLLRLGQEILLYTSKDDVNNLLITTLGNRGIYGSEILPHNATDGYDGYQFNSPLISLFIGFEDANNSLGEAFIKTENNYSINKIDGYKITVDLTSGYSNLQIVDAANEGFPAYDYAGYHRTDPRDLLAGKVNTYIGGMQGCADSDNSTGLTRGLSFQDANTQRQEMLLNSTGEPVCLFRRNYDGVANKYYDITRENTAYRGIDGGFGTANLNAYTQFFSTRRSDGRIMIRIPATKENVKRSAEGLENEYIGACWTIVTPEIKDGDFFIRFNSDNSSEFRYEITDTERNRMFLRNSGAQKFTAVRVRLTDPIYQVKAFFDTSSYPQEILTSLSSVGSLIPLHLHRIITNETNPSNFGQTTSTTAGHNHPVLFQNSQLIVQSVLGHTHSIIL